MLVMIVISDHVSNVCNVCISDDGSNACVMTVIMLGKHVYAAFEVGFFFSYSFYCWK